MARGACQVKDRATLAEIGTGQNVLGQLQFKTSDQLLFITGAFVKLAPHVLQLGIEGEVIEASHLADVERSKDGARQALGGDGIEQCFGKRGARYENGEKLAALGGME